MGWGRGVAEDSTLAASFGTTSPTYKITEIKDMIELLTKFVIHTLNVKSCLKWKRKNIKLLPTFMVNT